MPTTLSTPTITATVIDRTKIKIDGLSVQNASGYQVRIGTLSGGLPSFTVTPENGSVTFDKRLPRSVYYIQARALGDDENYDTSDWCAEISVQTGQIIDGEMGIPEFTLQTDSFTTIKGTGLMGKKEYRYQIATTEGGVASAPIKIYGHKEGSIYIGNLEPGTTYYVRFCQVDVDRCSLWSDIVSASTMAVTNTIEVTSSADSGTGSLRAAITSATNGTKIILNIASITLNSIINVSKRVFIVGGLTKRTIITPGNNNQLFNMANADWRHIEFTGSFGSTTPGIAGGRFSDCYFHDCSISSNAITASGYFWDCFVENCSSTTQTFASVYVFIDSVIRGCINTGSVGYGSLANSSAIVNALVQNCVGTYRGAASSSSFICASTLDGCSGCFTTYTCDVVSSSVINAKNGGLSGGSVYNCSITDCLGSGVSSAVAEKCHIENCRQSGNSSGGGAYQSTLTDCVVTRCYSPYTGGGVYGSTLDNCTITKNSAGNSGGGVYNSTCVDCVIRDNYSIGYGGGLYQGVATNCTIIGNYSASGGGGCNNSTLTDCTIENNESVGIGGISGGSALRCTISNNKGVNTVGGVGQATCTDCIISGNTGGGVVNGVYGGTLIRCLVTGHSLGCCSSNLTSSLIVGNYSRDYFMSNNLPACTIRNSTIGKGNAVSVDFAPKLTIYNSLYQSLSATPATSGGNIAYGNNDSDYFIDAANGDYRLKPGSLAIEQGNNSYVTGTMTTDLAGNPRISGTNVDVGCYEFVPVQLPTPILYLNAGHDQATIYFTLPPYCNGYLIEHADNPDFTDALTTTATSTGFLLPGLSGETYIRAKYLGVSGKTLDSEWSEVYEHYFDITAPTVIINALYDPIIMTVGDSIDLFSGVTVTDDYDELVIPTYEILDSDNETVEIGGETIDLPSNALPVGNYTIKYTATDQAENTATSLRSLSVRPPVLDTPVIAYHSSTTDTITVSGVLDEFADGWEVEVNGSVSTATPNSAGLLLVGGLRVTNLYNIKVKAIGNGITTSDSEWSNTVIASPSPAVIAYSDIHIKNAPTGQFSAVRKIDLDSRVPTGGEYGEVIVWGTSGPEWTPGVIPIWRVVNGE